MWELAWHRGRYSARRYVDGKRQRRALGTADRTEAERLLAEINASRVDAASVADLWDAYCHEKAGLAILATMGHTWKALAPTFGSLAPHLVTIEHCRTHTKRRRADGISDGTIHTELGHLSTVLNWAAKREHINRAPYIERPAKPAPRDRYLTRDEAAALLEQTSGHMRLAIILLIGTAARVGAILDLTWDRVDFDRGLIHLRDPTDTTRRKGRAIVPMNASTRAALEHARAESTCDYVVAWGSRKIGSLRKGLETASKRAGLENVSAHVLRHTAAVWMVEARVEMSLISQYLGHRSVKVTEQIYARYSPDYLRSAASALEVNVVHLNQRPLR